MQTVQLDFIADPICPWCFIAKQWLEDGLAEAGVNPFDIHWRPFQLNPDMPPEGMPRRAYLEAKFGKEQADQVYEEIEKRAQDASLDVDFARISRTPNTVNAHRLLKWARAELRQNRVADLMFTAYFRLGLDISDVTVLSGIAKEAGMDAEVVAKLLDGDADIAEIQSEDAAYRKMGVTAVPTFVVNGQYVVSGAQPAEFWTKVALETALMLGTPTHPTP